MINPGLPTGMGTQNFYGDYGPSGSYGAWPSCGCSSLFIILAGSTFVAVSAHISLPLSFTPVPLTGY